MKEKSNQHTICLRERLEDWGLLCYRTYSVCPLGTVILVNYMQS